MRPEPSSPQARSPLPGPTTWMPRARRVAMLAWVAGVRPHHHVHRRRHQDRLVGGEQGGGGEIVGEAMRHLGEQVGAGRRHHDQVGLARQADMAHLGFVGQREQLLIDLVAADRGEGERRDELGAAPGQDHAEADAAIAPAPDQLQRLVGGDAAGNDQENAAEGIIRPIPQCWMVFNVESHRPQGGGALLLIERTYRLDFTKSAFAHASAARTPTNAASAL